MLFLGIISWKSASRFNGGVCFSDGRASFLSGATPHEGTSVLMGGGKGLEKICSMGGCPPMLPTVETLLSPIANINTASFAVPQALKILISPLRQRRNDYFNMVDWI